MLADGCGGEDFEAGEEIDANPAGGEPGVHGLVAAYDEPCADGLLLVVDDEYFACWLTVGRVAGGDADSVVGEAYLEEVGGDFCVDAVFFAEGSAGGFDGVVAHVAVSEEVFEDSWVGFDGVSPRWGE